MPESFLEPQVQLLPVARNSRARQGLLLCGVLIAATLTVFWQTRERPLNAYERQLVGDWTLRTPRDMRTFTADRKFSTSDGQFTGVWASDGRELTVTYWQTFERPSSFRPADVIHSIRRTAKETVSWGIAFDGNMQNLILSVPVSQDCPDGEWTWSRVSKP